VLTSPSARILDVLRLWEEPDTLKVITLPGHGRATARYLKSRIFFMDKVSLVDLSAEFAQIDLEGPEAMEWLTRLGFTRAPELDEVMTGDFGGTTLHALGQPGFTGVGYNLLIPRQAVTGVITALDELMLARLTDETYHVLRVEAGMPASRAELTEEYTPLEAGLDWAISDSKGCYTGQEVIARQITYDKITQRLAGLHLDSPAQPGERVWVEGKPAGSVTSTAGSPRFGEIALAILKRPYYEPGNSVRVGNLEQQASLARVTKLPFE
jgi:folate-binding protein YgfZ